MSTTPPLHPTPLHVYTAPIPQTPPPGIPLAPETPTSATGPRLGDLEIGAGGEGNSPPPTPTPERVSQAPSTASMLLLSSARMRAISPPTPAPSPQPFSSSRFSNHHHGTGGGSSHHQDGDSSWSPRGSLDLSHGENEEDLVQLLRGQFSSLSAPMRLRLLTLLVADSPPSTLSPLLPLITPRLKRDFLRTLPVELAFHVLSFVDDVRTLARASGVSRFWRALLDDEGTWKRMCWKSGFGNADATGGVGALDDLGSPVTAGQRLRSLEFGEREIEEGTPAGRERRGTLDRTSLREFAARAEMFGLRPEDQVDLSQQANGWQPSTSGPTSLAGAVAGDNNNWGSSSTGLGIGSTFSAAPIVPSALALRRARTPRSTTPNGDPLPFHQTHSSTDHLPDLATLLDMADISPTDTTAARPARPRSHSSTERVPTASTSSYSSTSALVSPPLHSLSSSLPNHSHRSPAASAPTSGTSTPRKPFSYKTHFKRAYLTESNWLRGPGRLLSTQMSADDGVVTSLGFDSEWIVVGMATSKVHLFEAATGSYVKTLDGHELGVWCLTLVSKGGGPLDDEDDEENRPASKTAPNSSSSTPRRRRAAPPPDTSPLGASYSQPGMRRTAAVNSTTSTSFTNDSPTARSNFFRHGASRGTDDLMQDEIHAASPPRRRRSFHEFGTGSARGGGGGDSTTNGGTGPRTGGMGLGAGGETGDSSQQAGVCGTARGWGQKGAVVVSGGCDRDVRVWDVESGKCKHVLRGHTSTVRCMRVIDGRPIAVSGSRDATLRVWNIETGTAMHQLAGHENSVRCMEVSGNKVVSGSYDSTCRLWDVDTGECLHVFQGHIHQIYAVAFDGIRVVTGSLDSTVRVWSATTGEFLALLQGHTSLVGQLQLDPVANVLVTGGSDGRVIVFSLDTFQTIHRLCAHDNSVTSLQFDTRWAISGGNDGRIKLWDMQTGAYIRELSTPCDAVWRVTVRNDQMVILGRRNGKTVLDVVTFRPTEAELHGEL